VRRTASLFFRRVGGLGHGRPAFRILGARSPRRVPTCSARRAFSVMGRRPSFVLGKDNDPRGSGPTTDPCTGLEGGATAACYYPNCARSSIG
jgi:hypothetical protein